VREGVDFRDLLVADLIVAEGVAASRDVAVALQRRWAALVHDPGAFASEVARIANVDPARVAAVVGRVDALIRDAGGNARLVLGRRGGIDRSIHAALSEVSPRASRVLTHAGARARTPLREMPNGRYVDFHVAGEGGMGIVYRALDTEINRHVALKLVRTNVGITTGRSPATPLQALKPDDETPDARTFRELQARLLQEAWVTGGMEHPGIVPVYELGRTPHGIAFYTMRFVRGQRTLAQAIDEVRRRPVEERLKLLDAFLVVCDTIAYAHSKGVIHRDVKPANVALGEFGEVVLLDWGLARVANRDDDVASRWKARIRDFRASGGLRTLIGALGTPGYMAPEAAAGRLAEIDERSDVYGLGAMLFEILTGRLPHVFHSPADYARIVDQWEAPEARLVEPGVPAALSDVCARALSRERSRRLASVVELAAAVRAWRAEDESRREVEHLLEDVRAQVASAEEKSGAARAEGIERARRVLGVVLERAPEDRTARALARHVGALRERGLLERFRGGRRRRAALGVMALLLVLGAVGAVVVRTLARERAREAREISIQASTGAALRSRADARAARALVEETGTLWPLHPAMLPALDRWSDAADRLLDRGAAHAAGLRDLESRRAIGPEDPDDRSSVEEDALAADALRASLAALDRLDAARRDVGSRRDAVQLLARSDAALDAAWARAMAEVADTSRPPGYGGWSLRRVVGLVPLGADPASGLQEFAHVGSGRIPQRDATTGALSAGPGTAVVLVLVRDTVARGGRREVPSLLARRPLTLAQWRAMGGTSGVACNAGSGDDAASYVEGVSAEEARAVLRRHRLDLPDETQGDLASLSPFEVGESSGAPLAEWRLPSPAAQTRGEPNDVARVPGVALRRLLPRGARACGVGLRVAVPLEEDGR
jgi:serine/threonine protein kinase